MSTDNIYWHCKRCNDDIHLPFNNVINENEYMLELYRFFEDQSIIRDRMKPTFEDMKFDPLDKKNVFKSNNECKVARVV